MGVFINTLQPLDSIVRIDLSGGKGTVTKEFLDGIKVRSPGQKFRGKSVAEHMRRAPDSNAGHSRELAFDHPVHVNRIQACTFWRAQQRRLRLIRIICQRTDCFQI